MKDIDIATKLDDFEGLLGTIQDLDDKIKVLWVEVYKNALEDREAARLLFDELVEHMKSENVASNHVMHGQTLTRYLERMHRSNEQLLKLADCVEAARKREDAIDPEKMWDAIDKERTA